GPPCQAYSLVGRAQSSRMEIPMEQDPRKNLYLLYSRFLEHYKPTIFVFENVMGIESANGGRTWASIQSEFKRVGYEIECHEQNARDFGVMQNRRRMIIIGWRRGNGLHYPKFSPVQINGTVNELLQDLPKMPPGQERKQYRTACFSKYVKENAIR